MKVLIAEDDMVSSFILAARVRKMGHDVLTAGNGLEAWELYQREHPRLVITDGMMPEMDGFELCRRIRAIEHRAYTYLILLTALSGREKYFEGMEAGADDFVTKPLEPDGLHARLRVAERVVNLQHDVSQLEGLLPICSYCKKIRDADDAWHPLEAFVGEKTETAFEQTVCPECSKT
jgi:sigma-B regulation protein RsbU (phosphoserine phosphatase)